MSEVKTAAQQWQRVKTILADALELESPKERTAFLEGSCDGDTTLMREVEALLAQSTQNLDELAEDTPLAFARHAPAQPSGRRIGAYEIVREIGRGGMGAVYLAKRADGQFEKEVAIKLLKRGTDTDEILRRFQAERRILAQLDHPNIARLLDAGTTDDGLPYFVMEYIDGVPITSYARETRLSVAQRLQLFLKVCEAVQFAHQHRVVHRDLKPGNIFVRQDGEPKLLDFGIAKFIAAGDEGIDQTLTAERRFTPICASPEQARGETVTPASDVYALGALLYELLTDRPPHRFSTPHPSPAEVAQVIGEQEPTRPSLSINDNQLRRQLRGDLDKIVLMALRKEPEWRYASTNALADDIQSHLLGQPIAARERTTAYVATRFLRRHEKQILAAAALATVGIVAGFFLFHSSSRRELSIPPSQPLAREDIPEQATQDHEAYDLFLRARALAYEFGTDSSYQVSLTTAVHLLEEATTRDPKFALAYSLLAESHLYLYRAFEHTDAHLAAAKQAADTAQRLAPDSGAAHFAQAVYFYEGVHDLHRAETEITAALRALPERADAYEVAEKTERRLGRWKDAIDHGEKAIALDPRDPALIPSLAEIYIALRRYADVTRITDRALATLPPQFSSPLWRYKATAALGQADTKAARVALEASPSGMKVNDYTRFRVAVLERNFSEAERIADTIKTESIQPWLNYRRGVMARVTGNDAGAKKAFEAAREAINKGLAQNPNDPRLVGYLALVEAGLGENEEAIKQAQRAVDLNPISEDASNGAKVATIQAEVYAWVGQPRIALEKLAVLVTIPDGPNYGDLLLDPAWDSVRAEPAFAHLLEEARRPIDPIPNVENASAPPAQTIPDKSIAVLPFENLSDDKANSFFADGVQDEILTDLAKLKELKVISRTSVMQYKKNGTARNLREIAQQLGVAHVLEGSVQRAGNRIRISAQLIDARTDSHLWAEHYERDVADVFAIQNEIAKSIAAQLQAKISPNEKSALEQKPTTNLVAYDLYLRAKALLDEISISTDWEGDNRRAVDLLDRAVTQDPDFALAYDLLYDWNLNLYDWVDRTPARLARAEAALKQVMRIAPEAGETYRARSTEYKRAGDLERASEMIQKASQALPGNSQVLISLALVERRRGHWSETVRNWEKAKELDPRGASIPNGLCDLYYSLREYTKSDQVADAAIAAFPKGPGYFQAAKVQNAFGRSDVKAARTALAALPSGWDPSGYASFLQVEIAVADRNYAEVAHLSATRKKENVIAEIGVEISFMEALVARQQGDKAREQSILLPLRESAEADLRNRPEDSSLLSRLAIIDAYLGRKEEALREGEKAVELKPISRDAVSGPERVTALAEVCMVIGDRDQAIQLLSEVARIPYGPSYGQLLSLRWDSLRDDPRFQNIVAQLASTAKL